MLSENNINPTDITLVEASYIYTSIMLEKTREACYNLLSFEDKLEENINKLIKEHGFKHTIKDAINELASVEGINSIYKNVILFEYDSIKESKKHQK